MPAMPQSPEIHDPTDILTPLHRLSFRIAEETHALHGRAAVDGECPRPRVEREDVALWSAGGIQCVLVTRHVPRQVLWIRLIQQLHPVRGKTVRCQAGRLGPPGAVEGVPGVVEV